ncbi:MAG: domain S-box-containing protein [Mucilaginibacter sp.]|nr:domain S-box-containing protein [Mucilaginibacter sp.]
MTNHEINSIDNFNLELFFELSPDLICIAGYDGYFKRINQTVIKILGYTKEELFARPINEFVFVDDQNITATNRENLRKNTPLLNFENRYVTKSGEIVWLSWTSMPIESEKVVFAIAKNITHKKKQEDDRNLLLANLTKSNIDLKQLTYRTSHDLRSPVNNLLSIFSLLDVSKIQDEEVLEIIDMLKLSIKNLKDTLNNYIDVLSEKDTLNVTVQELDLNECLNAVLQSLKSLIYDSKATFHVDFSSVSKIKFNKAYLESVFLNLITNSIKYARPGIPPLISIYSKRDNGTNQLIFTDNGLGFDMDKNKNKVFGFKQKFHPHADSKGIGLYLVYNYIINLGGDITLESKVNEGSKFIISFKD